MPRYIRVNDGFGIFEVLKYGPLLNPGANRVHFKAHFLPGPLVGEEWNTPWGLREPEQRLFIGEIPGDPIAVHGSIIGITRTRWRPESDKRINVMFETQNGDYRKYYLVFDYDVMTRKGYGQIFNNEEFFESPVSHLIAKYLPFVPRCGDDMVEEPITFPEKQPFKSGR